MAEHFDPLATSELITAGYRRYLRSLLPVRDPRIAMATRLPDHAQPAPDQGAAAGGHSALPAPARRRRAASAKAC